MSGRVEGKVALITGAGRAQGRSHAIRLAEEGADILAIDILEDYPSLGYSMSTQTDLDETSARVRKLGRKIIATKADVRDSAGMVTAVQEGVEELGRLDIVCANAAICTAQAWHDVTPELWRDTIDTNLTGVWNTVVAGIPHLIAGGGGSIIIISSTAGLKGTPFVTPYSAAKHGLVGMAKSLANELGRHSIRVNTVHPTGVDTPMSDSLVGLHALIETDPQLAGLYVNTLPVRMVDTADVSNAVLYLASDEARYVTGSQFPVDAGYNAR